MGCFIRYATTEDAKALGYIHSQSWKVAYKGIIPDNVLDNITEEKREKYFLKALSENREEDALIFKNNVPVGLTCIGRCRDEDKDSSYGEIWGIYILPTYWNQGIGIELMNWGMGQLKIKGYSKATLWVLEENYNARKFYEKVGFCHDHTVKEINIGKKLNEIRYTIVF